ncbi:hypothetical protein DM02DRAFT_192693 [Periconia macrospinosa]|uniref:Uncharacterized protein n=1 Tax=Periconia macrospinosa TaxID=97972 RepID=A0A2V1DB10_9PLEO|nr:hypothetical protein DM02DRAFT_192693 [Periconia macrospinosa]
MSGNDKYCPDTQPTISKLVPPIPRTSSFPARYPKVIIRRSGYVRIGENSGFCLDFELKTPRLNGIHQFLWLAGFSSPARPLHRQKIIGRDILITEDPDEHLVWDRGQVFIKPLPVPLLDYDCWNTILCADRELYGSACGFLLSYAWLIRYKSDLDIAIAHGLVPKEMEWVKWVEILDTFFEKADPEIFKNTNKRYVYGELRRSRLDAIHKFLPPKFSFRNLMFTRSNSYDTFFRRNFKWMLAVFAVFSVVLSALQVGLATERLEHSGRFHEAAYGFAVSCLIFATASVVLIFLVWVFLFCYHLGSSWRARRVTNHGVLTAASP